MRTSGSIYKFEDDGTPKTYIGNTVISILDPVKNKEIWEAVSWVQDQLKESSIAHKLAFLPKDSFHMTWIPMCREIDRYTDEWPKGFSRDARMAEIDNALKPLIDSLLPTPPVRMEIDKCHPSTISLRPIDEECNRILRTFRDQAAELSGIRHPKHDEYRFHISVSYVLYKWSEEEEKECAKVCAQLTEALKSRILTFEVPQPQFVVFNDMLKFHPTLGLHDNL